ncbi:hypothetical protein AVEN_19512-1 [Araneus ventricosus]|uniref:Uncharacterized protein n=1 Tax=Araneus ventricosus TaxID=182803 RepID=A0A4Y2L8Y4_ARAVE|nr:hypothetical protein AVEN_19512-1 [Araneus ventricosus]
MVKRMKACGFLCEYQEVFDDWKRLKIIERVPDNELKNEKCHYLPHRPVIKLQRETTKIRPVFDASACEKGKPSLTHCLFKGINLIELIIYVIDRFRPYPIGLSRDIEKAFLMLAVLEAGTSASLIRAKTRVAPLKPLTIPRLKSLACCIDARLVNSIRDALNLPNIKVTFWSNSKVALWWIKEHGDWSVFITNRVQEIRQLTQFHLCRHVHGVLNVADMLSRVCSARRLLDSRWWEGPTWLEDAPENWPKG